MKCPILTFAAFLTVFHCRADNLPPPRSLRYEWTSSFALKLTWEKPANLPEDCKIEYEVVSSQKNLHLNTVSTEWKDICPRENLERWNYTITTVCTQNCGLWKNSTPVTINVSSQKPQADLVKDFRCALDDVGMNCSWIPLHLSLDLFYCNCSHTHCDQQVCYQPYSIENRKGCFIPKHSEAEEFEIGNFFFRVRSGSNESIVYPHIELHTPELNVAEEEQHLKLTWRSNGIGLACRLFEYCYTKCSGNRECRNISGVTHEIIYDRTCQYIFRTRITVEDRYCPSLSSKWSTAIKYGVTKPPDKTMTIVTIIIPIVLFVCVILSCYCFKRHSQILCPDIPDPSPILKELMEPAGNKEYKSKKEKLYTPQPEDISIINNSDYKFP